MISSVLTETNKPAVSEELNAAVTSQLEKILSSGIFKRSRRLRHFLRFAVEQTLNGRHDVLKEYSIGLEVFGKPETFDPRLDSIVRVEARRLRLMVDRYYNSEGRSDEVRISFRPGGYVPTFNLRPYGDSGWDSQNCGDIVLVGGDWRELQSIIAELERMGEEIVMTPNGYAETHSRIGVLVASNVTSQQASDKVTREVEGACEYFPSPLGPELLELLVTGDADYYFVNPVKGREVGLAAELARVISRLRESKRLQTVSSN